MVSVDVKHHVYLLLLLSLPPKKNPVKPKLQALVYDILPSKKNVPESDVRNVRETATFWGEASAAHAPTSPISNLYLTQVSKVTT